MRCAFVTRLVKCARPLDTSTQVIKLMNNSTCNEQLFTSRMAMLTQQTEDPAAVGTVGAARTQLISFGRALLSRGLLSQTSGNLSIRVSQDEVCITPSSMEYDRIEPSDIVVTALDGTVRSGSRPP